MRLRLVGLSLAITTMVVLAFLIPIGLLVRGLAVDRAIAPAQLRAQSLAPLVALADEATLRAAVQDAEQSASHTVHIALPDGGVLSGTEPFPDVPRTAAGVYELADGARVAVVPVVAGDGIGAVAILVPADQLERGVVKAWSVLGALGLLLVTAGAFVTDRLARRTTRALDAVEDGAVRLSSGDLDHRVVVTGPTETERIALALNQLADRTSALLTSERERAADLSHGLRTPLTALRLDAEALPTGAARDAVTQDVLALEEAIDQAIEQARRPVRTGGAMRCDLPEVVRDRAAWWQPLAAEEGRSFEVTVEPEHSWVGLSTQDAVELLDLLIDNVFTHTAVGTALQVEVRRRGTALLLAISDDGPGLPTDIDVFERGVSGAGSTGLGLSIVRRLVLGADGAITVEKASSRIEIRLPEVPGPR